MDKITLRREYVENTKLTSIISISKEAEIALRRLSLDSGIPMRRIASMIVVKAAPFIRLSD